MLAFQSRGGQGSRLFFRAVRVVFGQPDLKGHPYTSDQWPGRKHKIRSLRGLYTQPSYSGLCWQFEWIIFQSCWRVIKTEIGCFANWVTRELVSNFFGMSPSFYGLFGEMFQAVKKPLNKKTLFAVFMFMPAVLSCTLVIWLDTKHITVIAIMMLKNALQYPLCILELCTPPGYSPMVSLQWACIAPQPACHYTILWWGQCIFFICLWC